MTAPASRMEALKSDMAELQAKKQPSGQAKLDERHAEYEKQNELIEPMAQ